MKIYRESQMDCGGFKSPNKGSHLDTQLFEGCPNRSLNEQKKNQNKKRKSKEKCKKTEFSLDFIIKEI